MIAEAILTTKGKIIGLAVASAIIAAVDTQMPPASIEDYSLKGILVIAVVVLYRLLLKSQSDTTALRDKHEERLVSVIEANTKSNEKVCQLAEDQATYFRTVTRNIVEEKLHGKEPPLPP